jgi:transcription antitermination factor NusG
MSELKRKWFAVYTKPRWEKKVYSRLVERGVEAYCPVNKVRKKWSDRVKWVEEPLFKSYVFLRLTAEEMTEVRMVSGIVNFVYWLGSPAVVKDQEIEAIRKFLDEYDEVSLEVLELKKDTKITIRKGAFMNKEATVVQVLNNKVRVVIESLGYALVAVVERSNIQMSRK